MRYTFVVVILMGLTTLARAQALVWPDTIQASIGCEQLDSVKVYIYNGGTTDLILSTAVRQDTAAKDFLATFENGTLDGFVNLDPSSFTATVTTGGAAVGNKYLTMSGSGQNQNGLRAKFPRSTPTSISYYVRNGSSANINGVIQVGGIDSLGDFSRMFQSFFRYSDLRLYHYTGYQTVTASPGSWKKIELKNINFNNHTFDIYINNGLVMSNAGFYTQVDNLSQIEFFSTNTGSPGIDHFFIDDDSLTYSVVPTSYPDTIGPGDTVAVTLLLDAFNLSTGLYTFDYEIAANDTSLDGAKVHIKLDVQSQPSIALADTCKNFYQAYLTAPVLDSVEVINSGCSDLVIYGASTSSAVFNASTFTDTLQPGDHAFIPVIFSPPSLGLFQDSLFLQTNIDTLGICMFGEGITSPVLDTSAFSPISIQLSACTDSVIVPLHMGNVGPGFLNYNLRWKNDTIRILSFTVGTTSNYTGIKNFLSTYITRPYVIEDYGVLNSTTLATKLANTDVLFMPPTFSAHYAAYQALGPVVRSYVNGGGSFIAAGSAYSDNFLQFSVLVGPGSFFDNGGNQLSRNTKFANHPIVANLPVTAYSADRTYYHVLTNVGKRRLYTRNNLPVYDMITEVPYGDGYGLMIGFDYSTTSVFFRQLLANAFLHYGYDRDLPDFVTATPAKGSVQSGNYTTIPLLFVYDGRPDGVYMDTLLVYSNDTLNPLVKIPVQIEVNSQANIVADSPCIAFGNVGSAPVLDSVTIRNTGCANLLLTGYTFSNPQFTTSALAQTILPGDSTTIPVLFTPTAAGAINEKLTILNNDTLLEICLTALVGLNPVSNFTYTITDDCGGEIDFTDASINTPFAWQWHFGDGNVSFAQHPTHTYLRPGIYSVELMVTNAYGTDTSQQTVVMNDVFYVKAGIPATIYSGVAAQFYDSCQYATSVQWFFGDGQNTTVKDPVHTYATPGTYFLTFLAQNALCSDSKTYQIAVKDPFDVAEEVMSFVRIYPNPVNSLLSIETTTNNLLKTVQLFDLLGKRHYLHEKPTERLEINVANLPQGIYILEIEMEDGNIVTQKVFVED